MGRGGGGARGARGADVDAAYEALLEQLGVVRYIDGTRRVLRAEEARDRLERLIDLLAEPVAHETVEHAVDDVRQQLDLADIAQRRDAARTFLDQLRTAQMELMNVENVLRQAVDGVARSERLLSGEPESRVRREAHRSRAAAAGQVGAVEQATLADIVYGSLTVPDDLSFKAVPTVMASGRRVLVEPYAYMAEGGIFQIGTVGDLRRAVMDDHAIGQLGTRAMPGPDLHVTVSYAGSGARRAVPLEDIHVPLADLAQQIAAHLQAVAP